MPNAEVTVEVKIKDEALKRVIAAKGKDLVVVSCGIVRQAISVMCLDPKPNSAGPFTLTGELNQLEFHDRTIVGEDGLVIKDTAAMTITFTEGDGPMIRLGEPTTEPTQPSS